MASFHPVDHELIMCGKTELLLRRHSLSEPFVCVVMFLFCKSGNIYLCVCVCVVVVLFLNLLLFWIILSVLIFLLCHFPAHRTQKRWCHISNFKDDWSQTLNRLWERCWIYTSVPDLRALIPTVFEHDGYQSDPDRSDRSDRSDSCLSLLIWMWGEKFILEL